MENASKALLIAGGILLAVLVLSLLGLLLSNISSNQLAQEKRLEAEQLQEFNQQWEAYNKKALFGSDIITVVNKAIQNNKTVESMDENNEFYVNVTIDCGSTTFDTKITKLNLKTGETDSVEKVPASVTGSNEINKDEISLSEITNLGSWKNDDTLKTDNKIVEKFSSANIGGTYEDTTKGEIYYVESAFKVFKTTVFRCTGIDYVDGRVHQINFEIKS